MQSTNNSQQTQEGKKSLYGFSAQEFYQEIDKKQKEELKQLYRQIRIEREKAERLQRQQKQRIQKVKKKVYIESHNIIHQPFDQEENQEVPVDGDVYLGSRVYMTECSACHSLNTVTKNAQGAPTLGLLYNRKVGTDLNFFNYTKSLLNGSFFWTGKNLYDFMADPLRMLPGTKCGLSLKPLKNESDRADLIVFLKQYAKQLDLNTRIQLIKKEGYQMYQTKLYTEQFKNRRIRKDIQKMI